MAAAATTATGSHSGQRGGVSLGCCGAWLLVLLPATTLLLWWNATGNDDVDPPVTAANSTPTTEPDADQFQFGRKLLNMWALLIVAFKPCMSGGNWGRLLAWAIPCVLLVIATIAWLFWSFTLFRWLLVLIIFLICHEYLATVVVGVFRFACEVCERFCRALRLFFDGEGGASFVHAERFEGARAGYVFQSGARGLGYYRDANAVDRMIARNLSFGPPASSRGSSTQQQPASSMRDMI